MIGGADAAVTLTKPIRHKQDDLVEASGTPTTQPRAELSQTNQDGLGDQNYNKKGFPHWIQRQGRKRQQVKNNNKTKYAVQHHRSGPREWTKTKRTRKMTRSKPRVHPESHDHQK